MNAFSTNIVSFHSDGLVILGAGVNEDIGADVHYSLGEIIDST